MSAIDFVRSLYTVSDGNTLNGWSSSPSNGDTATANSQTYTYSSSRNLWVLATGVTNTITDGATYSWDGEKWIAQSHIPFRYFGPQASDPTGMSSDDAGDLYFNTTTDKLKVYTGSAWEDYSVPDDGSITPAKLSTGGPYWNTSGNVGIGTTSPSVDLDISPSSGAAEVRIAGAEGEEASIRLYADQGDDAADIKKILTDTNGIFRIQHYAGSNFVDSMVIDSSGRVGIGTTPSGADGIFNVDINGTRLHLGHGSNYDNYITCGASGNQVFRAGGNERLRITSAGDVGIGTTSPARVLEIKDASPIIRLTESGGTYSEISASTSVLSFRADDGNGASGTRIDFKVDGSEFMRITSAGNVGIGTTSPTRELHVKKSDGDADIRVEGTGAGKDARVELLADNAGLSEIRLGDQDDIDVGEITYNHADNNLNFRVNAAERLRIDSSGNVGIGTTSPAALLHTKVTGGSSVASVFESDQSDAYITFKASGTTANTTVRVGTTGDNFNVFANGSTRLYIDSNGNVGIGTTSPGSFYANSDDLVVGTGSGHNGITIFAGTTSDSSLCFADGTASSAPFIGRILYEHNTDSLSFDTNASQRMKIDSSGRVGIGTSSPSSGRLHVYTTTPNTVSAPTMCLEGGTNAYGAGIDFAARTSTGGTLVSMAKITADGEAPWNTTTSTQNAGLRFFTALNGSLSERMRVDRFGNIGVNSTAPNVYSGWTTITVNGTTGGEIDFEDDGTLVGTVYGRSTDTTLESKTGYVGFETGDTERMRITSAGKVGIGASSPTQLLDINGGASGAWLAFHNDTTGSGGSDGALVGITSSGEMRINNRESNILSFRTDNDERMRIDSAGRLLIGQTSSQGSDSTLQVREDSLGASVEIFRSYDSTSTPPRIRFSCSKGTQASPTVVTSGTNLGEVRFNGYDGLDYASQAAKLSCAVDGTPGANDMPGRLEFYTTSNGSNTPTERMRIDNAGRVFIGTTAGGYGDADDLTINTTGHTGITIRSGTAAGGSIYFADGTSSWSQYAGYLVYNHATDILSFGAGGAERMRIDSSGRAVIGGTGPGQSSADELTLTSTGHTGMTIRSGTGSAGSLFFSDATSGAYQYAGFIQYDHVSDYLSFGANTNEAMRIDSSSRLLLNSGSDVRMELGTNGTSGSNDRNHLRGDGDYLKLNCCDNGAIVFEANGNEGMRMASSGNVGIGRSNPQAKIDFQTNSDDDAMKLSGYNFLKWNNTSQLHFGGYDASQWTKLSFHTSGTERLFINSDGETDLYTETAFRLRTARTSAVLGAFTVSNGASSISTGTVVMGVYSDGDLVNDNNSYGSLSDSKLKENIVDASSQWDDIKALQVRKYNFKVETGKSTHTQIGVIAQEVETVSPGLVQNIPDTDDDGNDLGTVTKSVNYSVLYLKAVKALQEAMTRIETLEAKVAVLESN